MSARCRFPPPWTVEDIGGCFVVKASNDQPLVFIYYGEGGPPIPREIIDPRCRTLDRGRPGQAAVFVGGLALWGRGRRQQIS
jgi:hypothetical protein